jgi:hypothetical protein
MARTSVLTFGFDRRGDHIRTSAAEIILPE